VPEVPAAPAGPASPSAPPRRRGRRCLFAIAAVFAALLAAEIAVRVLAGLTGRSRAMTFDATLGWRMLPDVSRRGDGWSATQAGFTNSRGWRDGEHAERRVAGRRRLLALGDSCVFGANVDYGQRFTELLEDEHTEVLNMAVCAWATDQQVLAFEAEGAAREPDVVVWVVCLANDLEDIRCRRNSGWPKPYFTLDGDRLQLVPPVSDWGLQLRTASYLAELVCQVLEANVPRREYAPAWRDAEALDLFAALARRLATDCAACQTKLLAVLEPIGTPTPLPATEQSHRVRAVLEAAGIACLDLLPALVVEQEHWAELRLPCGHWSPRGHAVVAASLRGELARRGW